MNNGLKLAIISVSLAFMAACSSPEYIISTTDGTMIPSNGKPKLDEKTGMYTYKDAEGRVKCVACFLCATACPAHCIDIIAAESPWPDREKYPQSFVIDELRCIYCGMCEEACPVDAIELTSLYNLTGRSREEMIFDKEKLLSVYDATKDKEPSQSAQLGVKAPS